MKTDDGGHSTWGPMHVHFVARIEAEVSVRMSGKCLFM